MASEGLSNANPTVFESQFRRQRPLTLEDLDDSVVDVVDEEEIFGKFRLMLPCLFLMSRVAHLVLCHV